MDGNSCHTLTGYVAPSSLPLLLPTPCGSQACTCWPLCSRGMWRGTTSLLGSSHTRTTWYVAALHKPVSLVDVHSTLFLPHSSTCHGLLLLFNSYPGSFSPHSSTCHGAFLVLLLGVSYCGPHSVSGRIECTITFLFYQY